LPEGSDIEGERIARFPTAGAEGKRGFATLTIGTTNITPAGNWTATIRYYQEAGAAEFGSRSYLLSPDGQFLPI
jgi:hypothetical protein